jgi:hypothetical protein
MNIISANTQVNISRLIIDYFRPTIKAVADITAMVKEEDSEGVLESFSQYLEGLFEGDELEASASINITPGFVDAMSRGINKYSGLVAKMVENQLQMQEKYAADVEAIEEAISETISEFKREGVTTTFALNKPGQQEEKDAA